MIQIGINCKSMYHSLQQIKIGTGKVETTTKRNIPLFQEYPRLLEYTEIAGLPVGNSLGYMVVSWVDPVKGIAVVVVAA